MVFLRINFLESDWIEHGSTLRFMECRGRSDNSSTVVAVSFETNMTKSSGRRVVCEAGVEFVHVSKQFKTKRETEKERERLQ